MFKIVKTDSSIKVFNEVINLIPKGLISNINETADEITFNVQENNIFKVTSLLAQSPDLTMALIDLVEPIEVN